MKRSFFQEIRNAIFDRRLYGFSFFLLSGPPLAMSLLIMGIIYNALNPLMFLLYAPLFFILVLISGLGSKNYALKREVPNIGHFRGLLLLIASYLAVATPFLMKFPNDLIGLFQFLLLFGVSTLALTVAFVDMTIFGQRVSLRSKIQLTDDFLDKQKKAWKKELEGFPNVEKIISTIDDGKFVAVLFDRGSFNLAILWSCNIMEEIIDAVTNGIIQNDQKKTRLFKTEKGGPLRYPLQLKNLNHVHSHKIGRKSEQLSIDDLWDKVRNRIAHHKYKPTFVETYGALIIFVSFLEEFPRKLHLWIAVKRPDKIGLGL